MSLEPVVAALESVVAACPDMPRDESCYLEGNWRGDVYDVGLVSFRGWNCGPIYFQLPRKRIVWVGCLNIVSKDLVVAEGKQKDFETVIRASVLEMMKLDY
jgi:hypothetical protein